MRVTQFIQYNNFVLYQQRTLSALNNVQTQISTGEKIQNMYEDPVVYTKYLKLNEELNSFTQIKSSANFAETFANETDTTLNDFVTTLGSFKTNLLKAANDTNDDTSREAIVSELKGELEHLKDLANTSIDGKYLFSGSKFNTKPIDDNYQYQGNDAKVKAYLGAGIEREYNIDGASLFLGRDNDYSKHISTNMPQYDKMKANPQFVVRGSDGKLYIDKDIKAHGKEPDSQDNPINTPVTGNSQIRMLTGVSDIYDPATDTYKDGTSYFYIKGKKPDGTTIDIKFSMSNSDTVNDLLNKIGELYGNTATTKVVDVSLNDQGEIQVKDVQSGKMLTDFYMVASDKDEPSIDDLAKNGDYTVAFQKSGFNTIRNLSSISANNGYFDNRIFKFGSDFKTTDTKRDALPSDTLYKVLGEKGVRDSDGTIQTLDHLTLSGTDTDGNSVNVTLNVDSTTTMQDLMDQIKNNFGDVSVSLEDGKLTVTDNSINQTDSSKLSLNINAFDFNNNSLEVFSSSDVSNFDKIYMDKNGNEITSNVSQIVKDYKTIFKNGEKIIEKNPDAQTYATKDTVIADTMGTDSMPQEIKVKFKDKNGDLKTAVITLRNTPDADGHLSNFWIDLNNDGVRDSNEVFDIYEPDGSLTPAHDKITTTTEMDTNTCKVCTKEKLDKGMTYQQLADVISMITSDNLPASNSAEDYNKALNTAKQEVSVGMDKNGKFYLKDNSNNPSSIDLSMYTDNNSLYFQANNAVTVDEPQVDFFGTLQKAIDAVENGNFYPDGDKDPRSFGIEGAIEAIDHVTDHVRRSHAKIGAVSNEFKLTIERTDMLKLNVQQLQSDNIDTDIGEATMKLNSLQTSYQALLASVAKINNLTLLNYL
ncbi:flagellar hook-associated protein FlgL [Nautilia sp. PV-1]|uniref:flagellar hook-associated protein FlgL n=1 Tax=Nautilia sp. PV-1 TaxID=2579250 RepID=UPI001AEF607B|nr:flagellar hook-associated protein FlgL [Nautilia sp. PV-1]